MACHSCCHSCWWIIRGHIDCCCLCWFIWIIFFAESRVHELICSLNIFHKVSFTAECMHYSTPIFCLWNHASHVLEFSISCHNLCLFLRNSSWIIHEHLELQRCHVLWLLEASTYSVCWFRCVPSSVIYLHNCFWTHLLVCLFNSALRRWKCVVSSLVCYNHYLIVSLLGSCRSLWITSLSLVYRKHNPVRSQVIKLIFFLLLCHASFADQVIYKCLMQLFVISRRR